VNGGPYITRLCAWAPGVENSDEWEQWAQGKRDILSDAKGPAIAFTDSLFRRRLSQISKMTVQVVHDLMPVGEDVKMLFVSFRGELAKQFQINKMLIEEKSLMPAAFSLSVFNAPAALASIALGLKGGYSALYPGNNSFYAGLAAALTAFQETQFHGARDELIFIYADEHTPPEYACLLNADGAGNNRDANDKPVQNQCLPPLAFAFLLTREAQSLSVPLSLFIEGEYSPKSRSEDSPSDFLKRLILCGKIHVTP